MNFGIIGYGRMGHTVEQLACDLGHQVTAHFDIDNPLTGLSDKPNVDVLISFCLKDAVLENLKAAAHVGIPVVEGTTGWYAELDQARQIPNLTMIYSPNFTIGIYLFSQIVEYAARQFGSCPEYDCYLHEWHHSGKKDSPSGTAKNLAAILLQNLPAKNQLLFTPPDGAIEPQALHITSTRVGQIPGTHEIGFEGTYDSIQLRHTAHGREGFAYGAIRAAEWISGKKGIFTMQDFMDYLIHKRLTNKS
jgi:4-hydroxy-tetrahydrodipicolinate reductase